MVIVIHIIIILPLTIFIFSIIISISIINMTRLSVGKARRVDLSSQSLLSCDTAPQVFLLFRFQFVLLLFLL